ncbi:Uncharacterised protein [Chryseobacterium nakagawai]|nr:Uncharacterised protein [Chryseobacterium nakagawai]
MNTNATQNKKLYYFYFKIHNDTWNATFRIYNTVLSSSYLYYLDTFLFETLVFFFIGYFLLSIDNKKFFGRLFSIFPFSSL